MKERHVARQFEAAGAKPLIVREDDESPSVSERVRRAVEYVFDHAVTEFSLIRINLDRGVGRSSRGDLFFAPTCTEREDD